MEVEFVHGKKAVLYVSYNHSADASEQEGGDSVDSEVVTTRTEEIDLMEKHFTRDELHTLMQSLGFEKKPADEIERIQAAARDRQERERIQKETLKKKRHERRRQQHESGSQQESQEL